MVFRAIRFKNVATLTICGDSEEIIIELRDREKRLSRDTIHLHPKFPESLIPSWGNGSTILMSEKQKKDLFQYRISRCVRSMSDWGLSLVEKSDRENEKIKRERELEKQRAMDADHFIDTILESNNLKGEE